MAAHFGSDDRLLDDRAVGRQVTKEEGEAADGRIGGSERPDDVYIAHLDGGEVLGQRAAGDGAGVPVEQAAVEQPAHDAGDAAGAIEVLDVMTADGRAQAAEVGRGSTEGVEAGELDGDAGFVGDGEEVEDRVGGAAEGHVDAKGVPKGGGGEDLARPEVLCHELHDLHAGLPGEGEAGGVDGRDGAIARQAHAEGLGKAVHRIGGEHAGAGTTAGAGGALEAIELGGRHLAPRHGADGDKDVGEVDRAAVETAGEHRTTADDDGRKIDAGGGHQHAGDDLVAIGDENEPVKGVGPDNDLDGVGDQLAAGEGVFHAQVVHGEAVADADGVDLKGGAARHANATFGGVGDRPEGLVAGDHFVVGADDADEGLLHFTIGTAECSQQGAMGSPLDAAFEDVAFHHAAFVTFLRSPVPGIKKASRLGGFCSNETLCRLDRPRPNRHWLLNTQELNKNEGNNHDAERECCWLHDSLPFPIGKLLIIGSILPEG